MNGDLFEIYVYLSTSPLFGLTLTLAAFQAASWVYRRTGEVALLNPVLVSIVLVGVTLALTGIDYETYFDGAQFVHFLLGPATVALAIPLHRQMAEIRLAAPAVLTALVVGSATAILSAIALGSLLGGQEQTVISLAPKSATAPVAMSLSERFDGLPPLTAVLTVLTGIVGAVGGAALLRALRVRDERVQGFALGVTSHGIATARALQIGPAAGAFASLGFALNAVATPVLLPLIVWAAL